MLSPALRSEDSDVGADYAQLVFDYMVVSVRQGFNVSKESDFHYHDIVIRFHLRPRASSIGFEIWIGPRNLTQH